MRTPFRRALSLFRGKASTALSSSILILALNIASGVLLARALGPSGRGIVAAAVAWVLFFSGIFLCANGEATAYFVNKSKEGTELRRYRAVAIISGFLFGILGAASFLIALTYLSIPQEAQEPIKVFFWAYIPMNIISQALLGYLMGRSHQWAWNISRIVPHLVYTLLVIILIIFSIENPSYYLGALMLGTATLILFQIYYIIWRREVDLEVPSINQLYKFFVLSFSIHASKIISLSKMQLDKILLAIFVGSAEMGMYIVAFTLLNPAISIVTGFQAGLFSDARNYLNAPNYRSLKPLFTIQIFGLISIVIALLLINFGIMEIVVSILFGSSFKEASKLMLPLTIGIGAIALTRATDTFFIAWKSSLYLLLIEIVWIMSFLLVVYASDSRSVMNIAFAVMVAGSASLIASWLLLVFRIKSLQRQTNQRSNL